MAEVPVDFEVEIERENGDGREGNGADGLKKSEGSNGVSRDHCRLRYSGNTHCFREEDDFFQLRFCLGILFVFWDVQLAEAQGTMPVEC